MLVIHLKRFDGPYASKLSHAVGFEETLDLTEYLSRSSAERDDLACCAAELNPPHYNLTGVVVHQGFSANSGHYYAHVDICDAKGGLLRNCTLQLKIILHKTSLLSNYLNVCRTSVV